MKLRHAQYRALFAEGDYTPIIYFWEHGTVELPWVERGKYHDMLDYDLPDLGYTTEHLKELVEQLTGREVKRLQAW